MVKHENKEYQRRFIKGERRKTLAKELLVDSPSVVKLKKLDEADKESIEQGNLNDVPDLNIVKKILVKIIKS